MHHEQDMRFYGGLRKHIPMTFAAMTIGTLALTGFFFTAGYYSKDAILEAAFARGTEAGYVAFACGAFAAFLTSFYSWRLAFLTFFGTPRWAGSEHIQHAAHGDEHAHDHHGLDEHAHDEHAHDQHADPTAGYHPHESPWSMLLPLMILSIGAALSGWAFHEQFVGAEHGGDFWRGALAFNVDLMERMHHVPTWVVWTPATVMALGFLLAYQAYMRDHSLPQRFVSIFGRLHRFLVHKWYFDELYDLIFVRPAFALGRLFWKRGDVGIVDRFGPDGVAALVARSTLAAKRFQSGYVYSYALVMLIGVAAAISWFLPHSLGGQ
jgi:NADH-quinone oxidoreductase subunit L